MSIPILFCGKTYVATQINSNNKKQIFFIIL